MNRRHLIPISLVAGGLLTLTSLVGIVAQPGAAAGQLSGTTTTTISTSTASTPEVGSAVSAAYLARTASAQRVHDVRALRILSKTHRALLYGALVQAHAGVQGPMWDCIRVAESGGRYGITSGAYGILISSWQAYSYVWAPYGSWAVPGEAPAAVQDLVAYSLYKVGGGFGGWNDRCTGT